MKLGLALPLTVVACGDGDRDQAGAGTPLARTPACDDGDATPEQTEGPYFLPGSPQRRDLRAAGLEGRPLVVGGRVLSPDCKPQVRALLDFWQADGAGQYDTDGP